MIEKCLSSLFFVTPSSKLFFYFAWSPLWFPLCFNNYCFLCFVSAKFIETKYSRLSQQRNSFVQIFRSVLDSGSLRPVIILFVFCFIIAYISTWARQYNVRNMPCNIFRSSATLELALHARSTVCCDTFAKIIMDQVKHLTIHTLWPSTSVPSQTLGRHDKP